MEKREVMPRIDKIEYYKNIPTSQLLKEADTAETILSKNGDVSADKIYDTQLIIQELEKRLNTNK